MANPQKEDGHVDLANEIVEALAKTYLSSYESQLLWAIFRKTYGWHKKMDWITGSQLVKMTTISKSHVSETLKRLIHRNLVIKNGNKLGFQKNFEKWEKFPKQGTPKKFPIQDKKFPKQGTGVPQMGNKKFPKQGTTKETKRNYTKETIQKISVSNIFNHWNNQKIKIHRNINKYKSVIKNILKDYSEKEVSNSITNYRIILEGKEYYWTYKWTLDKFLKRGIEEFLDLEIAKNNYKKGNQNGKSKRYYQTDTPGAKAERIKQYEKLEETYEV